jgi:hypothetical protein
MASVILSGVFILAHLALMCYPLPNSYFWVSFYLNVYSIVYSASLCVSGGVVLKPLVTSDLGYSTCQSEISLIAIIGCTVAML